MSLTPKLSNFHQQSRKTAQTDQNRTLSHAPELFDRGLRHHQACMLLRDRTFCNDPPGNV